MLMPSRPVEGPNTAATVLTVPKSTACPEIVNERRCGQGGVAEAA